MPCGVGGCRCGVGRAIDWVEFKGTKGVGWAVSMQSTNETICVLGLGAVGLPLAAAFAARGRRVIGVDRDPQLIDDLLRGQLRHRDAGISAALASASERLRFATVLPQPG